jgi:hypothetical protein
MASDFFRINLRRLMTEKDIGVKALAAVTGVSGSQTSHYRSGDNAPDMVVFFITLASWHNQGAEWHGIEW